MSCRKVILEGIYTPEALQIITQGYIPCPVCGVIHTPEGDRKINILKEEDSHGKNSTR